MLPLVAIVGRPNVGKSTLFNRLVGQRRALVADQPGMTRDRHYGIGTWEGRRFHLVDTGGFEENKNEIESLIRAQAEAAIDEADVVVLTVDGRSGLLGPDQDSCSSSASKWEAHHLSCEQDRWTEAGSKRCRVS